MAKRTVRRALLVGINRYPDPRNNLNGCVNDALMMAQMLTTHFQFDSSDIRLLTDERATTSAIRTRLEWLVGDAAPGSVLLFQFSGHGSQVRDRDGDELDDGLDEILCPYDLDWDDPFTDDEIGRVIDAVPQGASFTVVLDCCHSGTGTRQFFKEPAADRAPNPRYLVPPPDVAFRAADRVELDARWPERTVNMTGVRRIEERRFGATLIDQNVILIAGCRSDQTSADAWIDNDNHGALSFAIRWTAARGQWKLSNAELVRGAGAWLETNGFSQIPQIESGNGRDRWAFLSTSPPAGPSRVTAGLAPVTDRLAPVPKDVHVVCVHGIGDHLPGWSQPWRVAFNRHLGLPVDNWIEVEWDSVFEDSKKGTRALGEPLPKLSADEQAKAKDVRQTIGDLILARHRLLEKSSTNGWHPREDGRGVVDRSMDRGFFNWIVNFDEYIGDFVKYLVSDKIRRRVDRRAIDVLRPLLAAGKRVVLFSHSWGTVVSYSALAHMVDPRQTVALHVTFGSPLWMTPVRVPLAFDGRRHGARHWINLDAENDIIGGALADAYQVEHDYKVPVPAGTGGAHSSFFAEGNDLVQREIVTPAIVSALA